MTSCAAGAVKIAQSLPSAGSKSRMLPSFAERHKKQASQAQGSNSKKKAKKKKNRAQHETNCEEALNGAARDERAAPGDHTAQASHRPQQSVESKLTERKKRSC